MAVNRRESGTLAYQGKHVEVKASDMCLFRSPGRNESMKEHEPDS
jgi:hypothetical protein